MINPKFMTRLGACMHIQTILNLVSFEDHELRQVAECLELFKGYPIHIQSRDARQAKILQGFIMKEL